MNARGTNYEARLLAMALMAVCSSAALAMPTQQELKKAQPLVAELMAPIMDDFKAKKKTAAEVADAAVKYAGEAETEAAKFMLYRSSIPYYVRGEAYDKAAEAVVQLKANVKDVPAEVVAEIISKATVRANKEKAPRLFELYQQAKTQAAAEKDVKEFRKKPASTANKRKLAEALATTGNWQEALKVFVSLTDQTAQMAKGEQDGSAKSSALGEFWWAYKPTYENAEDTFKIHAAAHYRKALAAGEITGLKKNIVEQRIKEYGDAAETAGGVAKSAEVKQSEKRELTFAGYLPRVKVLLLKGIALDEIREFAGTMAGSHVSKPARAKGYVVGSGDGWKTVQFQLPGVPELMCVQVRFEQGDGGVYGFAEKSLKTWSNGVPLGTDINSIGKKWWTAYGDDQAGWGIKDLVVTVGGKGATQASATTTSSTGSIELKTGGGSPFTVKGNEATQTPAATGLYCVIDLSDGPRAKKYPVSYLSDMPKGGWSDEYKTTKLVLRRIEPGAFEMGAPGGKKRVEIDKSFYLGVFEVTQKQWELVMGDRPSFWMGPQWSLRPVEQVSHDRIRGDHLGRKWPESDEVDEGSFMWLLRQKTNLRFDLPTEAQWEYACRAGTVTPFHNNCEMVNGRKDPSLDKIARYLYSGGWNEAKWGKYGYGRIRSGADRDCETTNGTAAVGSYLPNNWGLYDMLGNVYEYCLDKDDTRVDVRFIRGGHCLEIACNATAHHRPCRRLGEVELGTGLRLCLPMAGGSAMQK